MPVRTAAAVAAVLAALALPAAALPSGEAEQSDDTRVRVACLGGTAELRLHAEGTSEDEEEDDVEAPTIEIELRVSVPRPVRSWRVVLLHERRIVFEGTRRSSGAGYSFRMRRIVPDWPGEQTVAARLTAPNGRTCRLGATI